MTGLAGQLPEGERLLWEGSPAWRPFLTRVYALPWIALYVVALVTWAGAAGNWVAAADYAALALFAFFLLIILGYFSAKATTYSLTTAHLVIEYGIAFPKAVTIPYRRVVSANLKTFRDGTGDIALKLDHNRGLTPLLLWPNLHLSGLRPEPALRSVPEIQTVAAILSRALAAATDTLPAAIGNDAQDGQSASAIVAAE